MTYSDCFQNFAHVAESNPRIKELAEKQDNGTITDEESAELCELYDEVFFSPFLMKDFLTAEDDFTEEENANIKAIVRDMIDRGIIGNR